jgi:geranylgeranyl diphosphate synthase type II
MTSLPEYFRRVAELTDRTLQEVLPPEDAYPRSVHAVMRYSTFAGGKRLRPALIMAAHEACGGAFGADRSVLLAAAAYEMFHTFSLIHDDLPCMDDDDLRRGKPTAHRAFNEALAVLGGDALCILAFECLARIGRADILRETAEALGTGGMIGGQVVDIESEGKTVGRETVDYIHQKKTAALITASVRVGAMLAGAPEQTLRQLTAYGAHVGLAFQIVDDILDEEGSTEESKRHAEELVRLAQEDVAPLGPKGELLRDLAAFVRERRK